MNDEITKEQALKLLTEINKDRKNLQQRNAKAIEMIGLIIRDIEENNVPPKMQDLYEILSILQSEEVKDNEI